jgi:hypothetical protein
LKLLKGNIDDNKKNTIGTGNLLLFPLLGLLISSLVCKARKYFTKPTMVLQYQASVTESTANGRIGRFSLFAILALYVVFIWSVAGSISNSVRMFHKIINLETHIFIFRTKMDVSTL